MISVSTVAHHRPQERSPASPTLDWAALALAHGFKRVERGAPDGGLVICQEAARLRVDVVVVGRKRSRWSLAFRTPPCRTSSWRTHLARSEWCEKKAQVYQLRPLGNRRR